MGIDWYGPRRGPKSVEDIVSHLPAVKNALRKHANSMGETAEDTLLVHRRTGDAHIETIHAGKTDLDSYVMLKASGGKAAALSIELGHMEVNDKGEPYFEKGVHALSTAVRAEKRKRALRQ